MGKLTKLASSHGGPFGLIRVLPWQGNDIYSFSWFLMNTLSVKVRTKRHGRCGHGRAIFFRLDVLILYLHTCRAIPFYLQNYLMLWIRNHPTSLQGYETSTWMVFLRKLRNMVNYALLCYCLCLIFFSICATCYAFSNYGSDLRGFYFLWYQMRKCVDYLCDKSLEAVSCWFTSGAHNELHLFPIHQDFGFKKDIAKESVAVWYSQLHFNTITICYNVTI